MMTFKITLTRHQVIFKLLLLCAIQIMHLAQAFSIGGFNIDPDLFKPPVKVQASYKNGNKQIYESDYEKCQFWVGTTWFDLYPL